MSAEIFLWASLQFANEEAIEAANDELEEEGYRQHEDNLLLDGDALQREGTELRCFWEGSAPSGCFEITAGALEIYARHAAGGEAIALELDAGFGYRYPGGYDAEDPDFDDELEADEVRELHADRRGRTLRT